MSLWTEGTLSADDVRAIRPIEDYVIVERADPLKKSKGGIILPDNAQKESWYGKVIAVGPGKQLECGKRSIMELKVGDVMHSKGFIGWKLWSVEGVDFYVFRQSEDILGVSDKPSPQAVK